MHRHNFYPFFLLPFGSANPLPEPKPPSSLALLDIITPSPTTTIQLTSLATYLNLTTISTTTTSTSVLTLLANSTTVLIFPAESLDSELNLPALDIETVLPEPQVYTYIETTTLVDEYGGAGGLTNPSTTYIPEAPGILPPPAPPPIPQEQQQQPEAPKEDFSTPYHDAAGNPLNPNTQTPPHVPHKLKSFTSRLLSRIPNPIAAISKITSAIPPAFPDAKPDTSTSTDPNSPSFHSSPPPANVNNKLLKKPLGINCRGRQCCGSTKSKNAPGYRGSLSLAHLINQIPDNRTFAHLEKIACIGTVPLADTHNFICAWLNYGRRWGTPYYLPGGKGEALRTAKNIKRLVNELLDHGCKRCGSVPMDYPENNDGSLGYLTFNARKHSCPGENFGIDTVCPPQYPIEEAKTGGDVV
ncbi:hypothetical protein TWF730_001720 [Orbilia blumenaviensis]|uniref:Killer toxin Kp4 domain-containing protein n=1 Tax=Orbilia blumenaviensis TaxID=1796055 RepID=A0AAV9UPP3_9PEZI